MSSEFDIADSYKPWLEIILSTLSLVSLICACLLTQAISRTRHIAQQQAKLALSMDISMDNLLNNSADYAVTEFVILMSISDIFRSLLKLFRHFRSAFNVLTTCNLNGSISGIICLVEDFITWSLISNDIICYGVICFCIFRYLRKRSIFTAHSITPKRIHCGIISLSILHSAIQTILVILYYDEGINAFDYQIIYIPSLVILYCTVLYILSVFAYIRCCHPFWILSKSNTSTYLFLVVFTVIFILPITSKVILARLPSSHMYVLYIADVLLSQTGTGNFFAWYYSQRHHMLEMRSHEKLFHSEESVELGSDIEYVIDVQQLKNNRQNGKKQKGKKTTFGGIGTLFSPSNGSNATTTESPETRGHNNEADNATSRLYKPPTISIDVLAMEPVRRVSDASYSDQLFLESEPNAFIEPVNMDMHIANQYGINIDDNQD